jgi:hypothetical protein
MTRLMLRRIAKQSNWSRGAASGRSDPLTMAA